MMNSKEISQLELYVACACYVYGFIQSYMLFSVVISSQNVINENARLLDSIDDKKAYGWIPNEDPSLNKVIRYLNKFDGFSANDYFNLNKPLLIGMLANFVTYFIILVQFSYM